MGDESKSSKYKQEYFEDCSLQQQFRVPGQQQPQ